jgi:imidazolonepropionase-like amidohydrolase
MKRECADVKNLSLNNHRVMLALVASVVLFAAACSQSGGPGGAAKAQLVIRGGTLLDMTSEDAQPKALKGVVVSAGKIERVVLADSPDALPEAEQVVDAAGQYVLPGFIDAHVHYRPWHPKPSLGYGLTTLMDTGPCGAECDVTDPNGWIIGLAQKQNTPESDGPTLYYTGKKLDGLEGKMDIEVTRIESIDEIPARIDELVKLGANGIKVEEYLPPDFRKRIVEEAEKRGLPVVGHSANAQVSITAGMKFIEHMYPVGRALATDAKKAEKDPDPMYMVDRSKIADFTQMMVDNKVYLNPTMLGRYSSLSKRAKDFAAEDAQLLTTPLYAELPKELHKSLIERYSSVDNLKPADRAKAEKSFENVNEFVKEFSSRGGHLVVGSDTSSARVPGIAFHHEMQMLVDAGAAPYRVLLAATRYSAELMRKADQIGTVQAGKQADFVILGADPVADIGNAKNIRAVIRKGKRLTVAPAGN